MPNPSLPLSLVENITVLISPQLPTSPTFNQGLIIGSSTIIPYTTRIASYTSVAAMLTAGFSSSSPEVLAAQLYFDQSPAPPILWVGLQNSTGIGVIVIDVAGTGNAVGDVLTVVQGGAAGGQVTVTAVNGAGGVTGISLLNGGNGYTVATNLATTTTGAGVGTTLSITSIGETALQAVIECRNANANWYSVFCCTTADVDVEAIAAFVQTATPPSLFCFNTSDSGIPTNATNNLFALLKALAYTRTIGIYSTTQSGAFPNNAYAGAAVMGMLMGLNTGLANSQFTAKFKQLVGVATEPLNLTQVQNIENNHGNVYVSYQNGFMWFEQGVASSGLQIYQQIGLDYLVSDISNSVAGLLVSTPAIPQTNAGEQQLINVIAGACNRANTRGFIAGGVWTSQQVLNVTPGGGGVPATVIPSTGYIIQAQSFALQSAGNQAAGQAMPIYICIVLAGAVLSLSIGIYVQL